MLVFIIESLLLFLLGVSLVLPRARYYLWYLVKDTAKELWSIIEDFAPSKHHGVSSFLLFPFVLIVVIPVGALFAIVLLAIGPVISIVKAIKNPDKVDDMNKLDNDLHQSSTKKPKKTLEEIEEEKRLKAEEVLATHFDTPVERVSIIPDLWEFVFYSPTPDTIVEKSIEDNLTYIKTQFEKGGFHFFFLPESNRMAARRENKNLRTISYDDIKNAISIPEKVDAPCFINYYARVKEVHRFYFWRIAPQDGTSFLDSFNLFMEKLRSGHISHFADDDEVKYVFERNAYRIERLDKNIQDFIVNSGSWGVASIADGCTKDRARPVRLHITKRNKIVLPDHGNKEVKMEPIQKAVYFLFLRHPEGIFFKDLRDYQEELGAIYREITGRESLAGIQDSINKLTDPLNNSINEKCARIKNAFVSELPEDVAQWYFIDGNRGEKKSIKLPRDLVTWED